MTGLAVLWLGRNSRINVVTGKANRVTVGNRLERSLLEPEVIADIFRWFDEILFARLALCLICLVTDGTALRRPRRFCLERCIYE